MSNDELEKMKEFILQSEGLINFSYTELIRWGYPPSWAIYRMKNYEKTADVKEALAHYFSEEMIRYKLHLHAIADYKGICCIRPGDWSTFYNKVAPGGTFSVDSVDGNYVKLNVQFKSICLDENGKEIQDEVGDIVYSTGYYILEKKGTSYLIIDIYDADNKSHAGDYSTEFSWDDIFSFLDNPANKEEIGGGDDYDEWLKGTMGTYIN